MYETDHREELSIVFLDFVEIWIHRTSSPLLESLIRNDSQAGIEGVHHHCLAPYLILKEKLEIYILVIVGN